VLSLSDTPPTPDIGTLHTCILNEASEAGVRTFSTTSSFNTEIKLLMKEEASKNLNQGYNSDDSEEVIYIFKLILLFILKKYFHSNFF
jgi:hypothetical protein